MEKLDVLTTLDSMMLNLERTRSLVSLVACEFLDGSDPKGLTRDQISTLLWQIEENVREASGGASNARKMAREWGSDLSPAAS